MTRGIINDLAGQRFGHLLVRSRGVGDGLGNATWSCACDCGNVVGVRGAFLRKGQKFCSKQCPLMQLVKDIAGQRFGRLVAVTEVGRDSGGKATWEFLCDCGATHQTTGDRVRSGMTKSCGCLEIEARLRAGGRSLRPEYRRECWARYNADKKRASLGVQDSRIVDLYKQARKLTQASGVPHEVDHVLPLRGKYVSGLHVFANLQVVPRSVNRRKAARFSVDEIC